jgi:hypothetical protein
MMQLVHSASLVVVLLLASFGTASTECTWVLWEVSRPQLAWDIKGAHESSSACAAEQEVVMRAVLAVVRGEGYAEVKRAGSRIFFSPRTGNAWSTEYLCLPDTVDPRGPKK